ncbi:hypothetical protein LY76DRAFT_590357 [Colletotrichum caudatum]|nr:hypothetical protein LY76DRAFT_590357 [Colletotrichum caudatum]
MRFGGILTFGSLVLVLGFSWGGVWMILAFGKLPFGSSHTDSLSRPASLPYHTSPPSNR